MRDRVDHDFFRSSATTILDLVFFNFFKKNFRVVIIENELNSLHKNIKIKIHNNSKFF